MRASQHFHHGLYTGKLFTRENSQQAKEEREIFLGFHFTTTTWKLNQLIFWFFLRFIKCTRRKITKEIKLAWIIQ